MFQADFFFFFYFYQNIQLACSNVHLVSNSGFLNLGLWMGLREPMSPLKWYVECFIAGSEVGVELASVLFSGNLGFQGIFKVILSQTGLRILY